MGNGGAEAIIRENKILNTEEFRSGKTVLKSYPVNLGIDIEGRCNFKPPCVFCGFDDVKEIEGANVNKPFNKHTLEWYGPFFENTQQMSNCSVGEPFLSEDLPEILEIFEKEGKYLEMSTNGLLLNKKNRSYLLGKNITLYVSLDAATKETFAKLRGEHFDKIIENVRKLSRERKGFNNLPGIFLVFMPMKTNLNDLEGFVKMCADLKVDKMVLRPLVEQNQRLKAKKGGHTFIYKNEILSFDELLDISMKAKQYAGKYGVVLANQLDFGPIRVDDLLVKEGGNIQRSTPLCNEPWKSFYILRAGIKPCSYGHILIAEMKDFRKVWNGRLLRDVRKDLAKGKLGDYCLLSKSCPIVKGYFKRNKNALSVKKRVKFIMIESALTIYRQLPFLQRFKRFFLIFIR